MKNFKFKNYDQGSVCDREKQQKFPSLEITDIAIFFCKQKSELLLHALVSELLLPLHCVIICQVYKVIAFSCTRTSCVFVTCLFVSGPHSTHSEARDGRKCFAGNDRIEINQVRC